MNNPISSRGRCAFAAALLIAASAAHTQPALPAPEATDPVALRLMQGFPPPPDKVVHLANLLKYPNSRWGFQHLRELGPTATVSRGERAASPLPVAPQNMDSLAFDDGRGQRLSLAQWQSNTYTDALVVLHRGQIVYERMHAGMKPGQPHALWSMSKSFTGLLAAQLAHEGLIDVTAPLTQYLPELKESAWGDATVQQALDMTVSAQYRENFTDPTSGIFQYILAAGLQPAPASYPGPRTIMALLPRIAKEGAHGAGFTYKTVDTEVVGWLMQRVTGKSYAQLLSERIWAPVGAQEDGYVWVDPAGTQLTSIGLSAAPRDLARVGEMLRLGGRFNGRQVVAGAVIDEIRRGADREKFKASGQAARSGYSYHNQFWIPHDADGSFEMKGLNGQHLHVNPAAELVIVKLSSHPVGETIFTHQADRAAFAAIAQALRR